MFPSSATTTDGKPITSQFFMDSESCKPCHTDIYNQWQSSMHHMASFNNQWYRKSIEYMQDTDWHQVLHVVRRMPRPCHRLRRQDAEAPHPRHRPHA